MGFHDIAQFNQALLGKQAWRIWNNPSSLIAQILKHRYFANSSFLDSVSGSRPSFAWRSILHGRELLKKGLLHSVGDGSSVRLWVDNWISDTIPRPPKYKQDVEVNLSLRVDHLIDPIQHQWDVTRVRQLIAAEDVELVLKTKIHSNEEDSQLWCFSNNGIYSSRSGYQCMDIIRNSQSQPLSSIPPIERALWSKIWKVKTSPKIRHFLWRILSGALAVKDRLRSRCIPVDATCPSCDSARETICHLLFTCRSACEVWQLSLCPLPPAGFSSSSVFLNLHYLVSQALNKKNSHQVLAAFPWILWHLWKSRNLLCFEQRRLSPKEVLEKACEDSVIWHDLHHKKGPPTHTLLANDTPLKHWTKPPHGFFKCNIGSSFVRTHHNSGVSWITRNHLGITVLHSRRSYSNLSSPLENDLMSFYWAIESMRNLRFTKVIFQASSAEVRSALLLPSHVPEFRPLILKIMSLLYEFDEWSLEHTDDMGNQPAIAIATSVTRDQRYPSYISKNGPSWLQHLLLMESALD